MNKKRNKIISVVLIIHIIIMIILIEYSIIERIERTEYHIAVCEIEPDCNITQVWNAQPATPMINITTANNPTQDDIIYEIWKETLSNKTYVRNKYDCTDYSNDLHDILNARGIESRLVFGFYLNEELSYGKDLHCWIEINGTHYEPQLGRQINKDDYEMRKYIKRCW